MQPRGRTGITIATGAQVTLTDDQVTALIRDSAAPQFTAGIELLDITLQTVTDLSDIFEGGFIQRDSYATLHGTGSFLLTQELDWGTALLRPYMLVSDGVTQVRFNEGVYLTSSPRTDLSEQPIAHQVDAFDILHWIDTPVGDAYVVPVGTGYLTAVQSILDAQGIVSYLIDQTQSAAVLPSPRVWVLDQNTTWLNIINDLLASIGYLGIWSDWDGRLRVTPYDLPQARASEFLYDTGLLTSMLAPERIIVRDNFDAPNRWVFYWSQDPEGPAPVEGNGIYTFVNLRDGATSVSARGRVITAPPQQVTAVNQPSLIAQAQVRIDADLRQMTKYEMVTAPNPLHWHFDRVQVLDAAIGPLSDVLVTQWQLPLDGSNMNQQWSLL